MGVRVTGNTELIFLIKKKKDSCLGLGVSQCVLCDHEGGAKVDARLL